MVSTQHAAKAFDTATKEYCDCLASINTKIRGEYSGVATAIELAGAQKLLVELNNAAVEVVQNSVDNFNEQLRSYKARPN
jgi:hypothetical protein